MALPFELMRGFWDRLTLPASSRITFDDALARFTEGVVELFAPFAVHPERRPSGFFPAEHRAAILTAAAQRTLLRLTYGNVVRLVEPYALVFKRPQGGAIREYFYGYDTTGGRSSGPGIKSMFPERIQSIENTDAAFEPRYALELTKDGASSQGTFRRPFGSSTGRARARRTTKLRPYRVQCPYCNKVFTRERPSTRLNAHKNPFGSSCAGRVGFLV